jgi:hypothetical protein
MCVEHLLISLVYHQFDIPAVWCCCLALQDTVETVMSILGMHPCEGTEAVPPHARSHTVLLSGQMPGDERALVRWVWSGATNVCCAGSYSSSKGMMLVLSVAWVCWYGFYGRYGVQPGAGHILVKA